MAIYGGRTLNLVTLGDSHSLYSFAGIAEARIYWRGPVTMHRAARDGIRSLIPKYLKLSSSDTIILCLGEIDCRVHVAKQAKAQGLSVIQVVDELADRFSVALAKFRRSTRGQVALSCVPPYVPASLESDAPGFVPLSAVEARAVRQRMNERLSQMGVPFVDFYWEVALPDGAFRPGMSDAVCHIDPRCSAPVRNALAIAFGVQFSHRDPPWPNPKPLAERPPQTLMRKTGKATERILKIMIAAAPGGRSLQTLFRKMRSKR
jgi:hypothetical protein